MRRHLLIVLMSLMASGLAFAQAEDEAVLEDLKQIQLSNKVGFEAGFLLGNLLPNQVPGVREITGVGGLRVGMKMGKSGFAEATTVMGNGSGAEWKNLFLSYRVDIPVETLVGFAYVGPDVSYFKGANSNSTKMIFGGHVGGGIQSHIGGDIWFRAEMKFGVSPGTSLMINAGFVFRMPSDGGGGGAEEQ